MEHFEFVSVDSMRIKKYFSPLNLPFGCAYLPYTFILSKSIVRKTPYSMHYICYMELHNMVQTYHLSQEHAYIHHMTIYTCFILNYLMMSGKGALCFCRLYI